MNKIKLYWDIISPSIGIMLIGLVIFFTIGIVLSIPLCLVWNWLMPYIFGLPTINVLQAFGLSVLVTLLSPRKIDLAKNKNIEAIPDTKLNEDLNDKLEKVLQDITSQFKA
jgi:hypothetical protein|tara:strand:- start:495 stop:827 length:333 start_codon:yes stop_codon:yes gene_type:complete